MKIEINSTVKGFEAANCILGQAIKILLENETQRNNLDVSLTNVKDADQFRKNLLKGFFKAAK
jgi:hypothetical protein